jgi:hypothetical protein
MSEAEAALERFGYRRCDIPACNCGGWHGGHVEARYEEACQAMDEITSGVGAGFPLARRIQELWSERAPVASAEILPVCESKATSSAYESDSSSSQQKEKEKA